MSESPKSEATKSSISASKRISPEDLKCGLKPEASRGVDRRSQIGELTIIESKTPKKVVEKKKKQKKKKKKGIFVRQIRRTAHVTFDSKTQTYQGLPKEWEKELNKQFGLPPNLTRNVRVEGYTSPIPKCLVMMKDYLISHGGLDVVGIFRLAPDAKQSSQVYEEINAGRFTECSDVNCISNLIKVWFRELPRALLASVNNNAVVACRKDQHVEAILQSVEEPYQSVLLWLLDFCGEISTNREVNKMNPKNLAIVITPNLYKVPDLAGMSAQAAMQTVMLCKKMTEFFEKAINYRLAARET